MASEQANELFSAALGFAQRMLSEHGEFHPFGVSMDHGGKVAMVAGDIGSEHPSATALADFLQGAFADQAKAGAIQAAGICLDVKVTLPGTTTKSDAICVRIASIHGEAIEVYVPYRKPILGRRKFGNAFAAAGEAFVLRVT
jgi:hypothetical protein